MIAEGEHPPARISACHPIALSNATSAPLNTPLFDQEGPLIDLLHQVEDMTDEVLLKQGSEPHRMD